MSTAPVFVPRQRRIGVSAVRAALEKVLTQHPDGADQRTTRDAAPQYVHLGEPRCLVAKVLFALGFGIGVLHALEAENPLGSIVERGVRVQESRHLALSALENEALLLLAYIQTQQERGVRWRRIHTSAFRPAAWFARRADRNRKPWLYTEERAA